MTRSSYVINARRTATCTAVLAAALTVGNSQAGTLEAVYTADWLRNMDGGLRQDDAYLQRVDVVFETQIESVLGTAPATIFANVMYTDDTTFSDTIVGDAQVVSNIDTTDALRLFELWYEQSFGQLSARFGLYAVDSEFDVTETAQLFLNSSQGTGGDFAQSGLNGPSIFPVTSLALRLDWQFSSAAGLRYAILDGVPGDPDDPDRTRIDLGNGDGALHLLEFNSTFNDRLRLGLGYWRYSADFDYIDRQDALGNTLRGDGNDGWYVIGEGPVFNNDAGSKVNAFLRYGQADDAFNDFSSYLGAGFVVDAPFGQADAQLGFAIASVQAGDPLRRAAPATDSRETILELTYSFPVTDWLRLQPDIQYVFDPGVDPTVSDAWVLGIRMEFGRSWELGR